jgi:site-specific DNA recombinase
MWLRRDARHRTIRPSTTKTYVVAWNSPSHKELILRLNALFLKDLAQKTHRGLEGRVRSGMSGGGLCYGYDLVPGQTGARRIDEAEAGIVRRIFEAYAAGLSPRKIAMQLNKEGVPGPFGRPWRDTAIRGHIIRGTGILNNELYIGIRVWNRLRYVKDPVSGRRRSRLNPPELWIVNEVPELRIVDDELWDAVKRRQSSIRESEGVSKARATRFWERRRAQHLLTGLVYCGSCGGRMASVGRDYLACSAARGRGTCTNRQSIRRGPLEELILEGLRHNLMTGKEVEAFIAAFHAELNAQRAARTAGRAGQERELADVRRKLDGLIDAIAEGMRAPGLQQRLVELEARRAALEQALSEEAPPPVRMHPNLAQAYREKVEKLQEALAKPEDRDEAIEMLRRLIERVVVRPAEEGLQIAAGGRDRADDRAGAGRQKSRPRCEDGVFGQGGCGGSQPPTVRLSADFCMRLAERWLRGLARRTFMTWAWPFR